MSNADIAIVGISCVFPGADSLREFWSNMVNGVDAVGEIPPRRWHNIDRTLYPPEHDAHVPSMRGGYLRDEVLFDPLAFGVMPNIVRHGDADQFLLLKIIDEALRDARVSADDPAREKTDVIVGRGGYPTHMHMELNMRAEVIDLVLRLIDRRFPDLMRDGKRDVVDKYLRSSLSPGEVDVLSTSMPNIAASRAANRLNLTGAAYTVDAACASSLLAVEQAVWRLRRRQSDLAVTAGIFLTNTPTFAHVFARLGALSPTGTIRPFDRRADGLVVGEGAGAVVLKRLEDAVRDGNEVYAVIKGVGMSSDGRDVDVLAPSTRGQLKALQRAYADAGIDPATIGYLEGHGTGTLAGDRTEIATIKAFFGTSPTPATHRAMGTVKSMIGHCMPASGMAALIKVALSLSNKTIPLSLHCEEPHPELADAPFYVISETRPWVHSRFSPPRRAAVNAFGFGGANVHLVLEEAVSKVPNGSRSVVPRAFDSAVHRETELLIFSAETVTGIHRQLHELQSFLERDKSKCTLADVAFTLSKRVDFSHACKLALVCNDCEHLTSLIESCLAQLSTGANDFAGNDAVYFSPSASRHQGKLACIFPGMGFPGLAGDYPERLTELALHYPEVRDVFDLYEARDGHPEDPVPTSVIFSTPPHLPDSFRKQLKSRLAIPNTSYTMPDQRVPTQRFLAAMGIMLANCATWQLFQKFGIAADMMAGQSQGEMSALCAAEVFNIDQIAPLYWKTLGIELEYRQGEGMLFACLSDEQIAPWLERYPGTHICIHAAPNSVVIGGDSATLNDMAEKLRAESVLVHNVPYPPIHSPLLSRLRKVLSDALRNEHGDIRPPKAVVYSSITAEPYPADPDEIVELFSSNLDHAVMVWQTIRRLYDDGARIFVQVGGGHSAANVKTVLGENDDVVTAAFDLDTRNPVTQINHMCATIFTAGAGLKFDPLYEHRPVRELDLASPLCTAEASRTAVPLRIDWSPLFDSAAIAADVATSEPQEVASTPETHAPAAPQLDLPENSAIDIQAQTGMPFVGQILHLNPEQEVVLQRTLDLSEDLFLVDHCLAEVASVKPLEECLPTLPMTMSMELMGESAALLCPGLGLIGFEDVRAMRWIALRDCSRGDVRAEARLQSIDDVEGVRRVAVELHFDGHLCTSAVVLFGASYPEDAKPRLAACEDDGSWPWPTEDVYADKYMFHGPRFQCITHLGHLGNPGFSAELTVLPHDRLFRSNSRPMLLTDPLIVDGIGQIVGLWCMALNWTVFPSRADKIEIFGRTPPVGTRVPVRGEVQEFDTELKRVRVDLEVEDGAGNVWIRATGWTDWVFKWPVVFQQWLRTPDKKYLADELALPGLPANSVCTFLATNAIRSDSTERIARVLLQTEETAELELLVDPGRQKQFLVSRIAAKDGVRLWSSRFDETERLHPAAFRIGHDDLGRPQVVVRDQVVGLKLSLAHSDSFAVALVSEFDVGIDIESIGESAGNILSDFALAEEIALLESIADTLPSEETWPTRLWCAKEAAGKLLGTGLAGRPKDFQAVDMDESGQILIHHHPTGNRFVVTTVRVSDAIVAYTTSESAIIEPAITA